jgi:hypothetical protein
MQDEGIILRKSGHILALITKERGRVDALFFPKRIHQVLSLGTILSYSEKKHREQFIIEQTMIEHVPLEWARSDIHLLHYVLEICYFFMPVGGGGKSTFLLLKDIYRNFNLFYTVDHQKIIVCKLLAHLGIIQDNSTMHELALLLLETSIDKLDILNSNTICIDDLHEWIAWALMTHKEGEWFRAVPLLLKS